MSDTPRTDERYFHACSIYDMAGLAKELERENAELKAENASGAKRLEYVLADNARLRDYSDKLAAGLPEGMLPKDIENLRAANLEIAMENARLREALLLATEFARDLRGEWKWKEGAGVRNSMDYRGLCDCIELAESLLPNRQ